jgi:hypothetical protein
MPSDHDRMRVTAQAFLAVAWLLNEVKAVSSVAQIDKVS